MWAIVKKTAADMWEEMFYLLVFNLIWLVGALLILPLPFVTFGLIYVVHDIGDGRGIKFGSLFAYGKKMWKPAYIWGLIFLSVLAGLIFNLYLYTGIEASWASFLRLFILSMTIFWLLLQLVTLTLYPRLVEPSFKLAIRNASVVTARHPLAILTLMIAIGLIFGVTIVFPALLLLISFSTIALLTNNVIDVLVTQELERLHADE